MCNNPARDVHSPGRADRIQSLDILRGLMALAVVVLHFGEWTELVAGGTRLNNAIAVFGDYGVEGFFLLSGFCFFHLYGETRWSAAGLARFHIKRYFRIAPLFFLAATGTILFLPPFGTLFAGPGLRPRWIAENLTFTFGFFQPDHAFVVGGWSIGLEYMFYFALPLLTLLARRKSMLYVVLLVLLAWAWQYNFVEVPRLPHTESLKFHTYVEMGNHAFAFVLGAIIVHLRSFCRWRVATPAFLLLALLLFLAAIPKGVPVHDTFLFKENAARIWYILLCFLAVFLFSVYEVPGHGVFKPLLALGDMSYSLYLLHPFAFLVTHHFLPHQLSPLGRFATSMGLAFMLAGLSYRWLERPAMRLGSRCAQRV